MQIVNIKVIWCYGRFEQYDDSTGTHWRINGSGAGNQNCSKQSLDFDNNQHRFGNQNCSKLSLDVDNNQHREHQQGWERGVWQSCIV